MGNAICPKPYLWQKIHQRLVDAARQCSSDSLPPTPLILAGWAFTNDREKQLRWRETVAWAEIHGCLDLVIGLPLDSMHVVDAVSDYEIGPGGGPMYLPWNFDPKAKITVAEKQVAITKLQTNWPEIAGSVGNCTKPLRLTGAKGRRLLVGVNSEISPPWGSWTELDRSEGRRHFTRLRAAVNATISPLAVDHIDFVARPR